MYNKGDTTHTHTNTHTQTLSHNVTTSSSSFILLMTHTAGSFEHLRKIKKMRDGNNWFLKDFNENWTFIWRATVKHAVWVNGLTEVQWVELWYSLRTLTVDSEVSCTFMGIIYSMVKHRPVSSPSGEGNFSDCCLETLKESCSPIS